MSIDEIIVLIVVSIFCIGGLVLVKKNEKNHTNIDTNEDLDVKEEDSK
jgi:hypothetical protein